MGGEETDCNPRFQFCKQVSLVQTERDLRFRLNQPQVRKTHHRIPSNKNPKATLSHSAWPQYKKTPAIPD